MVKKGGATVFVSTVCTVTSLACLDIFATNCVLMTDNFNLFQVMA